MMQRLRTRASGEGGFTLIELLVVILIIGILAAIAIPTFLNQTSKANDSSAKSLVKNAETEAQTIATDHEGSYEKVTLAEIQRYESNIPIMTGAGEIGKGACKAQEAGGVKTTEGTNACLVAASGSSEGFTLEAESPQTKDTFTITDNKGSVTRSCSAAGASPKGGCVESKW